MNERYAHKHLAWKITLQYSNELRGMVVFLHNGKGRESSLIWLPETITRHYTQFKTISMKFQREIIHEILIEAMKKKRNQITVTAMKKWKSNWMRWCDIYFYANGS